MSVTRPPLSRRASPADETAARISLLCARLAELRARLLPDQPEHEVEETLEAIEAATIELAETASPQIGCCRQKAALLRERLLDMLDGAAPSEAVTLALATSLVLDLARLEE